MASGLLAPGALVDRYVVERHAAEGGLSHVYCVRHGLLGTRYALKLAHDSDVAISRAFITEGRIQSSLLHANVVRVVDALRFEGRMALVLDWVDGPGLDVWMQSHPVGPEMAVAVFRRVVRGVFAGHRLGYVHRDIKPENILLDTTAGTWLPRIIDFGLAKVLGEDDEIDASNISRIYPVLGTPEYMAPEQALYSAGVDQRADLFSLGCILYEMLTGRVAFESEDPREAARLISHGLFEPPRSLEPSIPRRLERVVLGLLEARMDRRTQSCEILLRQLDACLTP